MRVIITGGAGYIGSHTAVQLVAAGHQPVILDDFSNSSREVISRISRLCGQEIPWHEIDLVDAQKTKAIFERVKPDAVIHFAGLKAAAESVQKPLAYYRTNLDTALSVVGAMESVGCELLVFSSSALVYGDSVPPFREDQEQLSANNPYGWTKVMIEQILTDIAHAFSLKAALLRYFNPVGSHPSGLIGEDPTGVPNNLMPFIAQVAAGTRERLTVFGNDYGTPDGTCLRDYLHVMDLADGHIKALEAIAAGDIGVRAWNLGRGQAVSVLELIHAFVEATGQQVPYDIGDRRAGDPTALWADASRARDELGWSADRTVQEMCEDTWRWQSLNPHGYR